jgi:hypothetical protein
MEQLFAWILEITEKGAGIDNQPHSIATDRGNK